MRDTIDMAREAGFIHWEQFPADYQNKLKAFEALVRADERSGCAEQYLGIMRTAIKEAVQAENEKCAQICLLVASHLPKFSAGGLKCCEAIRSRGEEIK